LWEQTVSRSPDKIWLRFEDSTFTYEEAHAQVVSAAAALRDRGIGRADHVLVTARNTAAYLFTWLAIAWRGAVAIPVNPQSTQPELEGIVGQARPHMVVTDDALVNLVRSSVDRRRPSKGIVAIQQLFGGSRGSGLASAARSEDVAVMIPTSGTTGRSKLVMQTHRAYVLAAEGFPFWLDLRSEDRLMTSLPLFHINAPAYSILGSVAIGAGLVLLPRFSPGRFLDWARRYGATQFNAIGAMVEMLMLQPERDDDADNPIRLCYTGPSPSKERQLAIEQRFGWRMVCGYALSESPYGLIWQKGTRPYGTLGSARQHPELGEINEARVMRHGREVAAPGTGELELRNPALMRGYYGMPEETHKVLVDGWLRTGDLVRVNRDGTYTFIARLKEVIRRRGENLSPGEVEAVLESHPDVVEAAVVGVASELSEEEVKAFVVTRPESNLSLAALRDFAGARLAAYKVPRYFEVVAELPHTATGRVAKHRLTRARTGAERDLAPDAPSGRTTPSQRAT
jgi:crotonobetaine/carnitine-CoA ligase